MPAIVLQDEKPCSEHPEKGGHEQRSPVRSGETPDTYRVRESEDKASRDDLSPSLAVVRPRERAHDFVPFMSRPCHGLPLFLVGL